MTKNFRIIEGGHAEVREQITQNRTKQPLHDWDAPDWSILDDSRGELPEFPLDCLSAPVRAWVKRAANGAGVTSAHVAVPAIGIASSLVGMARRVQASRSWKVPMTCWSVVVGASGTGKTPGLDVVKRVLDWIERANRTKVGELRRRHETKAETAKAARAQWKKQVEEAVAAGQAGPQMPESAIDPGQFIEPRPYISDVTIERIGLLLQARPQGTLLLRDELSALFLNMSRYSGGQDKPFWLEAWNGGSSVVERVSRSLYIKYLLVGVAGGIQPSLLEPSFEGDHDGMYTRFLFAWPPRADYQSLTDDAEEVDTGIINVLARLDRLAEFADGNLVPKEIRLSKEARAEFEELRKWAHREQEAFDGREREWMAKATAHALRLAGTLCLLDWAARGNAELIENEIVLGKIEEEPTEIEADYMRAAIRLVQGYFWPHARAALRQIGLSDRHVNARRVLRWIKANLSPKSDISIEVIRVEAMARKLDAAQTLDLLAALERSGWVRWKEAEIVEPTAGRPARRWEANPRLFRLPEIPEIPETYINGSAPQPAVGVSGISGISDKRKPIANGGGGGGVEHSEPTAAVPSDDPIPEVRDGPPGPIPGFLDRRPVCAVCKEPEPPPNQVAIDGLNVWLHRGCEVEFSGRLDRGGGPDVPQPTLAEPPAQTNGGAVEKPPDAVADVPAQAEPPAAAVINEAEKAKQEAVAETAQTPPSVTGSSSEAAGFRDCAVCGDDLYRCFPLKCPIRQRASPH
jgi:uncharacterized protein DUF3987